MKQEEKSTSSKERIIHAAMQEFGTKSYNLASLNTICSEHGISKGLLYHYFENKDVLYLVCVQESYHRFLTFLSETSYDFTNVTTGMNSYFSRRSQFFHVYPLEGYVFLQTHLQPPSNLTQEIKIIQTTFDAQSSFYYSEALEHLTLKETVTKEEALEYFSLFQTLFHNYFCNWNKETNDFSSMKSAHEQQLAKMLNWMLYGIVKENPQP